MTTSVRILSHENVEVTRGEEDAPFTAKFLKVQGIVDIRNGLSPRVFSLWPGRNGIAWQRAIFIGISEDCASCAQRQGKGGQCLNNAWILLGEWCRAVCWASASFSFIFPESFAQKPGVFGVDWESQSEARGILEPAAQEPGVYRLITGANDGW